MFTDLNKLNSGHIINCDVCIIGGGAAGITVAREIAGDSLQVCLVESGSMELENATQALYEGSNVGLPYEDLDVSRLRYFGGTTNHWNGWCAPFSPMDFESRDWISDSGWPIDYDELVPFYKRAHTVCELGPFDYSPSTWQKKNLPLFSSEKVEPKLWQLSPPTRFGEKYQKDLKDADNIQVLLNANATGLSANDAATRVTALNVASLSGRRAAVHANKYIVACGGIENARLLLLSNDVQPDGLGNGRGLVGRYFMEHPSFVSAVAVVTAPLDWMQAIKHQQNDEFNHQFIIGLGPSDQAQRRLKILNQTITFHPLQHTPGSYELAETLKIIRKGHMPDDLARSIGAILADLDGVTSEIIRRISGNSNTDVPEMIFAYTRLEQAPNRDSRVFLDKQKDALGLRKVALDWQLTELDRQSVRRANENIAEEFGRLGLGRIQLKPFLLDAATIWPDDLIGGNHHMGTTRMSNGVSTGVVDSDCRIHGVDNLYIAGSSVFPTSGFANPTLTIVALALRLSDHLRARLS